MKKLHAVALLKSRYNQVWVITNNKKKLKKNMWMILPQRNQKSLILKHSSTKTSIYSDYYYYRKTEPFSLPPPQDFSEKKTKQICILKTGCAFTLYLHYLFSFSVFQNKRSNNFKLRKIYQPTTSKKSILFLEKKYHPTK